MPCKHPWDWMMVCPWAIYLLLRDAAQSVLCTSHRRHIQTCKYFWGQGRRLFSLSCQMQVKARLWLTKAQPDPSPTRLTVIEWVGFDSAQYQLAFWHCNCGPRHWQLLCLPKQTNIVRSGLDAAGGRDYDSLNFASLNLVLTGSWSSVNTYSINESVSPGIPQKNHFHHFDQI